MKRIHIKCFYNLHNFIDKPYAYGRHYCKNYRGNIAYDALLLNSTRKKQLPYPFLTFTGRTVY